MFVIVTLLKVLFLIVCVLLVAGVLFSHQKSEGLSGIMGGMSQSSRGVRGMDQGMRRIINYLCAAFIVLAFIVDLIGV